MRNPIKVSQPRVDLSHILPRIFMLMDFVHGRRVLNNISGYGAGFVGDSP